MDFKYFLIVFIRCDIRCGEEFFAVEHGVCTRHEAQGLRRPVQFVATGSQTQGGFGHEDAGDGDGADPFFVINAVNVRQRCAFDRYEAVDRYGFRVRLHFGQGFEHADAVGARFAEA